MANRAGAVLYPRHRPIAKDADAEESLMPEDQSFGFAADYDAPIRYIERTREYYQALGYGAPYRWAHFAAVPFQALARPLARCRVALVTTAAPYQPGKGEQGPGAAYNAAAKFYRVYSADAAADHDLRISHVAYDRAHTTAEDSNTWFPLPQLRRMAANGRIGEVVRHFYGIPTNRSQRQTLDRDCPELLARCRADAVDAAILVPNCPVCHQTVSLAARHLEEHGIATVVMGCAKDIVEYCGVPRFLFSDFPLGNSTGRPHDPASHAFTLELALRVLEAAPAARTTVQSPLDWCRDPSWKLDYCNIERLSATEIARLRREFDRQKEVARSVRSDAVPAPAMRQ
jgi:D-proline reductase (dithiol) PrdB